jgi:hypothetical protein
LSGIAGGGGSGAAGGLGQINGLLSSFTNR